MPDTQVRMHLPVTARVRGTPGPGQLDAMVAAAALGVRRAVAQARARAWHGGWRFEPHAQTRVAVRVLSTEAADTPLPSVIDAAIRAGVRLGASQALFDLGVRPASPDLTRTQAALPPPGIDDPPTLAIFESEDELQTAAKQLFPDLLALLPEGRMRTGVYGISKPTMMPALFWVTSVVAAGLDRGKPVWQSIAIVMGDVKDDQWVARGAGNEPAPLLPGGRYRLDSRIPKLPPKRRKGKPAPRAYIEEEGGARRRPVHLSDGAYEMVRNQVVRFAVPFGAPVEPEVVPEPKPPLADDVRRRRTDVWQLLHGNQALPATSEGEPEWLWEWFGYLNLHPASVRANPQVREAIMWLIRQHGAGAIIDMDLLLGGLIWRREFLKIFSLQVALAMLKESRNRMVQFRTTVSAQEWRVSFSAFLKSLAGTATTANRYRRIQRRLRLADEFEQELKDDPDFNGTEDDLAWAVAQVEPDREELRRELATLQPPIAEEATLTLAGEEQPLLIVLTIHQGRRYLGLTQVEEIAESIDEFAPLGPDELARVIDDDLQWLIDKTVEAENRLFNEPDDSYQLAVVQQEVERQLTPWFLTDPSAKQNWDSLIEQNWATWLGLGLGLLILAFVFPAGLVAVSAFLLGASSAFTSVSRAVRLRALSRARLAQSGFQQLVSEAEVDAAIFAAAMDVIFVIPDIGPAARAVASGARTIARGTGIVARRAAGALGLRLERVLLRARDLTKWPQPLVDTTFSQLRAAIEQQRPALTRAGVQVTDADQLASEMFEAAQLEMVARYEQHLAGVRSRFGQALESGNLTSDDMRALRDWLAQQRLRPDDFLQQLAKDPRFFDDLVARQARGQAAGAARPVSFLPVEAELAVITVQLGPLARLLGPERVFAFREAVGLSGSTYREVAGTLATILRRVDAPEETLAALERLLARRPDTAAVLDALGRLPNPQAAMRSLTPQLLDQIGAADLVRAVGAEPGVGDVVERIVVAIEGAEVGQLIRGIRRADGTWHVQRWQHATASWEPAPRRLLPEGEPVPATGQPAQRAGEAPPRPPEVPSGRLELEFEEFHVEEPPRLDQPPSAVSPATGGVSPPPRTFREVLDSVQITRDEIARYRDAYRRYVRERGASRSLRTLDNYARWRHGIATRQFSPAEIRAAVERSWERFAAAIERVPIESIPPADLVRLRAQYQQNLAGAWRGEPYRMLSEDEWVRWRHGVEQNRILAVEGPPKPLGEQIGQLAGHELERVINGRLPGGSANSRNFKIIGVDEGFRPDHLPAGSQTTYLDRAGRIHQTPGGSGQRTPFSARYVGDSKYLEGVVPFDAQTEAFVRLAAATDEKAVVFYVRWRDGFPPPAELTAGPFGVGFELPAATRGGVVSGNLLEFATDRKPPIKISIVSDPNWR